MNLLQADPRNHNPRRHRNPLRKSWRLLEGERCAFYLVRRKHRTQGWVEHYVLRNSGSLLKRMKFETCHTHIQTKNAFALWSDTFSVFLTMFCSCSIPFPGQTLSRTCLRFFTGPQVSASSILTSPRHYHASPPLFSSFFPGRHSFFPPTSRGPISIKKQSLSFWKSGPVQTSVALSTRDPILFGPISAKQWTLSAFFSVSYPRHASKLTLIQSHNPIPTFSDYFLDELFPLTILSSPDILCLRGKHTDAVLWKLFMLGISKPPLGADLRLGGRVVFLCKWRSLSSLNPPRAQRTCFSRR